MRAQGGGEAQTAPGASSPSAPVALEELPDYVGGLLDQIERLSDQVRELEREVELLRGREDVWRDVERRVQAVIAGSQGRARG